MLFRRSNGGTANLKNLNKSFNSKLFLFTNESTGGYSSDKQPIYILD
jgi:hypothetical protein